MDLEQIAEASGIPRVTVLHGHTSQETAYLQEDYPYGSLRCQRRVWLEQTKRGYRLVTQTSNPKRGNDWNNAPKKGTYTVFAVMVRDPFPPEHEHIEDYITWTGCGIWGPDPAEDIRVHVSGVYDQLTERERKVYDVLVKMNEKGNSTGRKRWYDDVIPTARKLRADLGRMPTAEEMLKAGLYMSEHDMPAVVASLLITE